MDEGLSRSGEVARQVLGGTGIGIGGGALRNSSGYGASGPPSSDENQNRLREEELDGEDEEGRGGRELFRQDSMNNNEEMDNRPCPQNLDTQHKDSSTASILHSTNTGVPGVFPSACPPQSTLTPAPSTSVALLRELQEDGDHPRLPQQLHQIAEAYFLEEDYERALQFIRLERLYHERLLSNLAALQEHWESRWTTDRQGGSQPQGQARTDLRSVQLETLSRICRTHQRPSLSVEKQHAAADRALKSMAGTGGETADGARLPCGAHPSAESGRLMEEQRASEEASSGPPGQSEDTSASDHQRAESLCNSDSPAPPADAPASPDRGCFDSGSEGGEGDAKKGPGARDQLTDGSSSAVPGRAVPPEAHPQTEDSSHSDTEQAGAGTGDERGDKADMGRDSTAGEDLDLPGTDELEAREGEQEEEEEKEDFLEEDFDEDEFGDETISVTRAASLDELAKRIKVEQTTPTPGLVSILKRRSSLEGSPPQPPAPPKQVPKRKVRFSEPDDMVDPDDVGLDSCLLLLLLCMVTMVISVGGTALYCTLADAQSSVCTDFSHNVDFYLRQVQRGVDEIRHWLSHSS